MPRSQRYPSALTGVAAFAGSEGHEGDTQTQLFLIRLTYYVHSSYAMKRKAELGDDLNAPTNAKRRVTHQQDRFRQGLFEEVVLDSYTKSYQKSEP